MSPSDALLTSYFTALDGNTTLPVFSAPPDATEVQSYIFIGFDTGGNEGDKTNKSYLKRINIEAHSTQDNYSASRQAALDAIEEIEDLLYPTPGAVIDMSATGYVMTRQELVDQGADDTLYSVTRMVRIYTIFEVELELINS